MASITPFFLWSKLSASFGLQAICAPAMLPAIVALFTCSLEEPKERARRKTLKRIERKIVRDGLSGLLVDRGYDGKFGGVGKEVDVQDEMGGVSKEGRLRDLRAQLDKGIRDKQGLGSHDRPGRLGGAEGPSRLHHPAKGLWGGYSNSSSSVAVETYEMRANDEELGMGIGR